MKIEYLSYLLEVARCKSISAAARRLRLQQASLSGIIRSLEKELGAEIFKRTPTGVQLTACGENLLLHVEEVVKRYDTLKATANSGELLQKNNSIVCYHSACSVLGPFLAQRLQKVYPETRLYVNDVGSNKLISSLAQGISNIAVGITASTNFFKPQMEAKNNGFQLEPVYIDHYCVCVREDSPLANQCKIHIEELVNQQMATRFDHPQFQNTALAEDFRKLKRYSVFSCNEGVKRSVLQYGFAAILPRISFYRDIYVSKGDLVIIPLCGIPDELTNYIAYNNQKGLSSAERFILDELRAFFKSLADEQSSEDISCSPGVVL